MSIQNVVNPVVPNAEDILLGEGVYYRDFGESGEEIVGATRGGSTIKIDGSIKEIEFDGAYGKVENMRRTERNVPMFVINFLKMNADTLNLATTTDKVTGTDEIGSYTEVQIRLEIKPTDVLTNLTFVGYKASGEFCRAKLYNVLNISPIQLEFKDKDEVVSEMTYTGFYFNDAPTVLPLDIDEEV